MRARAMQAVEDAYIAKYGADSLQDMQQRIEFGEWLCLKRGQVFQFKGMLQNVQRSFFCFLLAVRSQNHGRARQRASSRVL
jgi:hypothetical protein